MANRREKTMDLGGLDVIVRSLTVGPVKASPYNISGVPTAGTINTVGSTGTVSYGTVPGSTVVASETTIGDTHVTKLTLTSFAVGTGGDAADLALGALVYTFPSGTIMVENSSIVGTFDQASHGTITDGECGLGTVVGSTAVDTLGEVGATSENILNGDTGVLSTYVLGTTLVQASGVGVGGLPLTILSAGVHTVFLNIAATWPNIAAAEAVTFTGTITIRWRKIS